jgi:hypothetical protein
MSELNLTKFDKMRLGRRASYLRKCILAAELIDKYETNCTVRVRIFNEYIQPVLRVCYSTFNRMLGEKNPQKQLDEINDKLK